MTGTPEYKVTALRQGTVIDHLPVVVDGSEFVITAVVSLLICSLSTVAPSAWAANMLPVDGLRYE